MYDHYTAIYHLLLDRNRLHRCSYPLDKQISSRQNRRPSTVAENALSHPKYQQHLLAVHQHQQQQQLHQQAQQLPSHATAHIPPSYAYAGSCTSDYSVNSVPMSSHTSINNTYSTSAESGLEVDMDTGLEVVQVPPKPPLARRHTLTGMTGIPGAAENMLRNIGGPSVDSGHGMELNSESQSIDSNLDSSEHYGLGSTQQAYNSMYPYGLSHIDNSYVGTHPSYNRPNDSANAYEYNGRRKTKSPINFREGRRASDGLVCQDVIAFRQRLKDGMKAGGMLELRHEHNKLLESIGDVHENPDTPCNSTNTINNHIEPPPKPALGKRMSLPTASIDLPPHKLLELKKSIQVDHHLARGQEAHDITHPFGPLMTCDPIQNLHPFSNGNSAMSLQRQAHYNNNQSRKLSLKQSSSLHQQFQQMHIGQTMCMGRGIKHPPVTRQPSYKMAQQQTVMPSVFNGSEMICALPLEHTPENSNFLLQVANTCAITSSSTVAACNSLFMPALTTGNHFPPHTNTDNAGNTAASAASSGYNMMDGSSSYMY